MQKIRKTLFIHILNLNSPPHPEKKKKTSIIYIFFGKNEELWANGVTEFGLKWEGGMFLLPSMSPTDIILSV